MSQQSRRVRGFTLVEMIVVVAVIGLILSLVSLEFISVVSTVLHTRANTDAESQARTAMSKIGSQVRSSYWDYVDYPPFQDTGVASPQPGTTTVPYIAFYRVTPGSLVSMPNPCTSPGVNFGAPCPPFELVTIELSATTPGELDEIITPQPNGPPSSPMPIAYNVSDFEVTSVSSAGFTNKYDIRLQVSQPSTHCTSNSCTYTLDNVIFAGGNF
jgi:prepilin-type N-terminal cleavage/methylation domain-containing protein